MRTDRSLPYGWISVQGGSLSPLWTESQTGVKTLPCRKFVAGGKNKNEFYFSQLSLLFLITDNVLVLNPVDNRGRSGRPDTTRPEKYACILFPVFVVSSSRTSKCSFLAKLFCTSFTHVMGMSLIMSSLMWFWAVYKEFMAFFKQLWLTKGHNQAIMNDKKGHNILNDGLRLLHRWILFELQNVW